MSALSTRTSATGWDVVNDSNDGKGAGDDNDDYGDDDEMKNNDNWWNLWKCFVNENIKSV